MGGQDEPHQRPDEEAERGQGRTHCQVSRQPIRAERERERERERARKKHDFVIISAVETGMTNFFPAEFVRHG